MSNIADVIEDYILDRLNEADTGIVELRRADIADFISCAPSQISYVLSTRFTEDKGFSVVSRRGLGGFIRIVHLKSTAKEHLLYQNIIDDIDENTSFEAFVAMIKYLLHSALITKSEEALILHEAQTCYRFLSPKERVSTLQSLFKTLATVKDV